MLRTTTLLLCTIFSTAAFANTIAGHVIRVIDGDTLQVQDAAAKTHRIRLAHIDAPESDQLGGAEAKESLAGMTLGQPFTADCKTVDRYGRAICTVLIQGEDINAKQVERGMAWVSRQYPPKGPPMLRTEALARIARRGLWQSPSPTPPWIWRREHK